MKITKKQLQEMVRKEAKRQLKLREQREKIKVKNLESGQRVDVYGVDKTVEEVFKAGRNPDTGEMEYAVIFTDSDEPVTFESGNMKLSAAAIGGYSESKRIKEMIRKETKRQLKEQYGDGMTSKEVSNLLRSSADLVEQINQMPLDESKETASNLQKRMDKVKEYLENHILELER